MLFHTWHFLVFFIVVYLVYLPLRKTKFWLPWLLAASYFFYGWWNPLYLFLIFYSTALNYLAVWWMEKSRKKKAWFIVTVVNNLFLLGFFKYANFVTENLNVLFFHSGIPLTIPCPGILLPVGISFFTFQSMSYAIDFYRGNIKREPSFIRFATFVSFFPQLVAGPIERSKNLLPQLTGRPEISLENVTDGLSLFFVGLFKKVALADYLALYVERMYAAPALADSLSLILATFAFGWQIYFDFAGYTDMARGLAKMMGFNLMLNFNNPYLATGLGDFWNRWHISLSTWFKDYLYIPLGGNRRGKFLTYRNIFLVMVISGIWHGAAWTFFIWGLLHAVGMLLTRGLERSGLYKEKVPRLVKQLATFVFVTFAWIFFRAGSLNDAFLIINRIFTAGGIIDLTFPLLALGLILSIWAYQFLYESKIESFLKWAPVRVGVMASIFLYLCLVGGTGHEAFIYFQF